MDLQKIPNLLSVCLFFARVEKQIGNLTHYLRMEGGDDQAAIDVLGGTDSDPGSIKIRDFEWLKKRTNLDRF